MRLILTLAISVLGPAAALAQTPQYQGGDYDTGTKRVRVYGATQEYTDSQLDLFKAVENYQKNWVRVRDERELWLARYRIYENVISLRGKDEVMRFLDQERAKLGVSELEGYQRLGIYNPYADTSYIRYYDHKTGEPKISEVRGFYDDLEKQRKDIEERRSTLTDAEKKVNDLYEKSSKAYENLTAAKKDLEAAEAQARAARLAEQAKPKVMNLAGRTGQGEWLINGRTIIFTYEFQAGGRVIYRSNTETIAGTWTQNGTSVSVRVGQSSESGTLSGNKLVLRTDTGNVGTGTATLFFKD